MPDRRRLPVLTSRPYEAIHDKIIYLSEYYADGITALDTFVDDMIARKCPPPYALVKPLKN